MCGLPGGHVESGESNEVALIRELKEETNSEIQIQSYLGTITINKNNVYLYKAIIKSSELFEGNTEISEIKWLKINDFIDNLKEYDVENWELLENLLR